MEPLAWFFENLGRAATVHDAYPVEAALDGRFGEDWKAAYEKAEEYYAAGGH